MPRKTLCSGLWVLVWPDSKGVVCHQGFEKTAWPKSLGDKDVGAHLLTTALQSLN